MSDVGFEDLEQATRSDGLEVDPETEAASATTPGAIQDPRLSDSAAQPDDGAGIPEDDPRIQAVQELLEGLSGVSLSHDDPFRWIAASRKALQRVDKLEDEMESAPSPVDEDATTLDRYANIPEDEREKLLSTSDHIAAVIHENWSDLAWALGDAANRRYGVNTATKADVKHNPSKLKVDLKKYLDKELQSMQIYRAMQAVASLSGPDDEIDESTDDAGRTHIVGGEYEYHERPTPDNSRNKRELYRVNE